MCVFTWHLKFVFIISPRVGSSVECEVNTLANQFHWFSLSIYL